MTVELRLDKVDTEILQQVLQAYLSELRFEIANTDSFDYRTRLHDQEDRIKRTIKALDGHTNAPGFGRGEP